MNFKVFYWPTKGAWGGRSIELTVWFLYNHSGSSFHINQTYFQSDCQSIPLSPNLLIIFMDLIFRHNHRWRVLWSEDFILLFDVVLLASPKDDSHVALGRFITESEAAGMSTSSLRTVFSHKWRTEHLGSCSWVREGGNGKWRSPDWCSIFFSVVDAVLVCTATATLKRNVHVTAKLSIYPSVYVTSLTYGHKLWEVTERIRLQKQVLESALPKWCPASSLTCQYTLCNGHIAHCHVVITHMQPFIPGITPQELAAVFS